MLSITGGLAQAVWVDQEDYASTTQYHFTSKYAATGNQRGYAFRNAGAGDAGKLQVLLSSDGTVVHALGISTVVQPTTPGWIAYEYVPSTSITFYTSSSPVETSFAAITWTQLGDPITNTIPSGLFSNTSPLEIGSFNGGTLSLPGDIHRSIVASGSLNTGLVVFDAYPTSADLGASQFTESSGNGAIVTVNGSALLSA